MYSAMYDSKESHVRCHVTELMDRSMITCIDLLKCFVFEVGVRLIDPLSMVPLTTYV